MMEVSEYRSIWSHLKTTTLRQGWVDAGGIGTRYVQAGPADAPALVMLHGTGGTWECFSAILEEHSKHFNCFAIDFVGSGFSDKPDTPYEIPYYVEHVASFMDAMGIDKASLIGVSLGAWVSARFAVTYPQRVEKMTLVAPAGLVVNKETMGRTKGMRTRAVDDPSWENIKTIFNSIIHDEKNRIPDLIHIRQSVYLQPEMKQAMKNILVLQDEKTRTRNLIPEEDWRSIQAPILVVLAPDDNPDFYITGQRVAELAPNSRTVEIRGVKHWAQFEKPDVFNAHNLAFLLGQAPQAAGN